NAVFKKVFVLVNFLVQRCRSVVYKIPVRWLRAWQSAGRDSVLSDSCLQSFPSSKYLRPFGLKTSASPPRNANKCGNAKVEAAFDCALSDAIYLLLRWQMVEVVGFFPLAVSSINDVIPGIVCRLFGLVRVFQCLNGLLSRL